MKHNTIAIVALLSLLASGADADPPLRAASQGSTLYNPDESYDVNRPFYPVAYSAEQKKAQRDAGRALVEEVNAALCSKKAEYRARPGIYPNSDIVIRNNRIAGSSSGAIIVQNSDRVQIAGNDCRRLFQRKAPTAAIAVFGSGHVTITGNRVEDCPAPAIKAQWVDGLECRGNAASRLGTADKHTVAVDLDHVRHADIRENTVDRSQLDAVIRQEHCLEGKQPAIADGHGNDPAVREAPVAEHGLALSTGRSHGGQGPA